MTIFYYLRFVTTPTWRARSPYLYPPGTGWPSCTPKHWVPFSSPSTTRRATMEVLEPASTRESQSQSNVTTDGQSASLFWCQVPTWDLRPDFYYCLTLTGFLMWGALSEERTGLSFTIAAGPRQHSHSWVWVSRDSWPYFTGSDSSLRQPGGPGPRIYIPQDQGGPVIPPGIGFKSKSKLHCNWRSVNQ
jgi:hypothetical protein